MSRTIIKTGLLVALLLLAGCTKYAIIENEPIESVADTDGYSVRAFREKFGAQDTAIMVAFSGGGTRAAALAYGVLRELKNTPFKDSDSPVTMLDQVGLISSVSGGSFTAAYYGLYGDRIFDDFERRFLNKNVTRQLVRTIANPLNWFKTWSRTEFAIREYDEELFDGATFADMKRDGAPMIWINASDLSSGSRFTFTQEYFNLLCSDLTEFPVSRAVAASSAVPILFTPVVIENHGGCYPGIPDWFKQAKERARGNPELNLTVKSMESYFDKEEYRYMHLVDGGITDNLGLRSLFDIGRLAGSTDQLLDFFNLHSANRFVIISVDASTVAESSVAKFRTNPSTLDTITAMSDIQLHRYNIATVSEMKGDLLRFLVDLNKGEKEVDVYFVRLSFDDIPDPSKRAYLNNIPTNFSLSRRQVSTAIDTGSWLLRNNDEFQRLRNDLAVSE